MTTHLEIKVLFKRKNSFSDKRMEYEMTSLNQWPPYFYQTFPTFNIPTHKMVKHHSKIKAGLNQCKSSK